MTATQMLPAIGQTVMVSFESLNVACKVTDVKTAWNKVRLQVTPLTGSGAQWVEMQRIDVGECRAANVASLPAAMRG